VWTCKASIGCMASWGRRIGSSLPRVLRRTPINRKIALTQFETKVPEYLAFDLYGIERGSIRAAAYARVLTVSARVDS
jgi:hypothetical protein